MLQKLKKELPSLTIVIPAFNEEASLEWVLNNTMKDAPKYLSDFEVIIVNDGSSDKTGEIADFFAKKNKKIRVFHQKNKGYSFAMLKGIKEATKEFIAFMPADGQFLIKDMIKGLPFMKSADLILGYRGTRKDYTIYRLILSYGYLILLRILFGITYKDINWLNIWRANKLKNLKINSRSVFLLAEIIVKFKEKKFRIVEAPSFYRKRRGGEVKHANFKIAWSTFVDMWKLWFSLRFKD